MKINSMRLKPLEIHHISHQSLEQTLEALRALDHQEVINGAIVITMVDIQELSAGKAQFQVKEVSQGRRSGRSVIFEGVAEVDPLRNGTLISGRIVSPNVYWLEMLIMFILGLPVLWGVGMNNAGKAPHIIISGYVAVALFIATFMAGLYLDRRRKSLSVLRKVESVLKSPVKKDSLTRQIEMVVQQPLQKCLFLLDQLNAHQQTGARVEQTIVETQLQDAYHASFSIKQRLEVNQQLIRYLHLIGTLTEDENFETTTVIGQLLVPEHVEERQAQWAIVIALVFVAAMSLTLPMYILYKLAIIALCLIVGVGWWLYERNMAFNPEAFEFVRRVEDTLAQS